MRIYETSCFTVNIEGNIISFDAISIEVQKIIDWIDVKYTNILLDEQEDLVSFEIKGINQDDFLDDMDLLSFANELTDEALYKEISGLLAISPVSVRKKIHEDWKIIGNVSDAGKPKQSDICEVQPNSTESVGGRETSNDSII